MLHHARETIHFVRRREQMDVVGHEHVSVNQAAVLSLRFRQAVDIEPIVLFGEETYLPIVAPLDDVLGQSGKTKPSVSWHVNGYL